MWQVLWNQPSRCRVSAGFSFIIYVVTSVLSTINPAIIWSFQWRFDLETLLKTNMVRLEENIVLTLWRIRRIYIIRK